MIPILILAAGASSRMRGRDKLLEEIDGTPQLARIAQRARATGHPVWVALPPKPHPRHAAIADLDVHVLQVPDAAEGLNASLRFGIAHLLDAPAVLITLADLVDLDTAHFEVVIAARQLNPQADVWRGATAEGKPGHPTLVDHSLFAQLCALEGDSGAQSVLAAARVCQVPLPGQVARMDLDTPEDWARWRKGRATS